MFLLVFFLCIYEARKYLNHTLLVKGDLQRSIFVILLLKKLVKVQFMRKLNSDRANKMFQSLPHFDDTNEIFGV